MKKAAVFILLIAFLAGGAWLYHRKQRYINMDAQWIEKNYKKRIEQIAMRDGVKLITIIYEPLNTTERHPILLERTPYSIAPYDSTLPAFWNNKKLMAYLHENYVIVYQNVRGKLMSEGEYEDIRPYKPNKKDKETDESSDAYDTIDWLVHNVKNNNERVGVTGISYAGFYAFMAGLSGHPALRAVSPQAPVTDWFEGDDFHHNGAFMMLDAFTFYSSYGKPRHQLATEAAPGYSFDTGDKYKFYMFAGNLHHLNEMMGDSISFWKSFYEHPDYDTFWQSRNIRNFAKYMPAAIATLVTGGLFDAEDCFGAWNLYKALEEQHHGANRLVMGPWSHGDWAGGWGKSDGSCLGSVRFGSATIPWYHEHIEVPFFNYYLKGKGDINSIKKATIFFTGANEWKTFDQWPAAHSRSEIFLRADNMLSFDKPATDDGHYLSYISDPANPVPYADGVHEHRTVEFMIDDQRFAAARNDVLTYNTNILTNDVMVAGPVIADLFTSISTSDADFVVKLIDVFPGNFSYKDSVAGKTASISMNGYRMLVRAEIMRGKYRNSLSLPQPFIPGEITEVKYQMPDVAHVFKKGHKIMIQVQSSWFPLADRNPQQFTDIYQCADPDFIKSTIKIYSSAVHASNIVLPVLNDTAQ